MSKRVIIIHGWDGYPEEGWFPWLKSELEKHDFHVEVPAMPESGEPKIETWVPYLASVVGSADEHTYFVGHSIGVQTILRYLETLPPEIKVGGAVFVAGWFTLTNAETPEEQRIGKPWIETPIDFEKVKLHTDNFLAIFSDDDPVVPISNKSVFEDKLYATTITLPHQGHFSGNDEVTEIPMVLDYLLKQ